MNFYATHYQSGEKIKPGDCVLWHGKPGKVLFVVGMPGVPTEWLYLEHSLGAAGGFLVEAELAGLVFANESDEDLYFVGRGP